MNTKTQELVTAGYALAKGLDAEYAKLVKELATELAVQRVRADELNKQVVNLAVENAGLKAWANNRAASDDSFEQEQYPTLKIDWRQRHLKTLQTPATDAAIANIQAQAIPTGWQLIPEELHISEEDIELICSQCGNGDELYGEFVDGIFRVGEVETDDGKKVYGLHISCADYQGEGSVTIATFDNPLRKESGNEQ